jgi:glycerol uptake facilitator-like aquaporin
MNPARTFGPNIASGLIEIIPIYFGATIIGAVMAAGIRYKLGNPPVQSQ